MFLRNALSMKSNFNNLNILKNLNKINKLDYFAKNSHFSICTSSLNGIYKNGITHFSSKSSTKSSIPKFNTKYFNSHIYKQFCSKKAASEKNKNDESSKSTDPKDTTSTSSSSSSSDSDSEYEDPNSKAKYINLLDLYNDQESKLEFTKQKFLELKEAFIAKNTELENIKVRTAKEIQNNKDYAITKFAKDLLDICDNFTRALDSVKEIEYEELSDEDKIKTFNDFAEGLSMNLNSFKKNLNKNGLQEINPIDCVYDPDKHNVIENYEDLTKVSSFGL